MINWPLPRHIGKRPSVLGSAADSEGASAESYDSGTWLRPPQNWRKSDGIRICSFGASGMPGTRKSGAMPPNIKVGSLMTLPLSSPACIFGVTSGGEKVGGPVGPGSGGRGPSPSMFRNAPQPRVRGEVTLGCGLGSTSTGGGGDISGTSGSSIAKNSFLSIPLIFKYRRGSRSNSSANI